jgi:hypothetical protein
LPGASRQASRPKICARPDEGRIKPSRSPIVVDLPAAVRAEISEHLAGFDLEIELVQCNRVAITFESCSVRTTTAADTEEEYCALAEGDGEVAHRLVGEYLKSRRELSP